MILRKGNVGWCELNGENYEQKGVRPCVVCQNNAGNKYSTTTIIVPLTASTTKAKLPVHVKIDSKYFGNPKFQDSIALFEQVRVIDKSRIISIEGKILSRNVMEQIDRALIPHL
ncbi:type II toxin-antitoxin system PemK/MazF family toxin [Priestia filamentosa]|uniref:type II toxin-antitoxin system PemK/MazF family toxin n=1 Tax=Priestia filamentosa TaxID=1402861 RepID=UPI003981A786